MLGGEFSSRLNMNLREDKHWAYGSYSGASNTLGQRPWIASAAVQSDKTVESIKELRREVTERFGDVGRGVVTYGIMRAIQIRRFRLPRAQIKHGESPR